MQKSKTTITPPDTSLEASLLKVLSVRDVYTQYIHFIDFKRLLPNTALLLKDYAKYYELYSDDNFIRFDEFFTQFAQNWHINDLNSHDIEYYRDYVIPAIQDKKDAEIEKTLLGLIHREHVNEIEKIRHDPRLMLKIRDIVNMYEDKINKVYKKIDKDVHTIENIDFEILDKANGIPWFMPSLQKNLMSLSEGQFVIISADYGSGKTAFVISQAVYTFRHLIRKGDKRPILYFNSEGTAADVLGRFLSNLYKDKIPGGFEEIVDRRAEVKEKFIKAFDPSLFKVMQLSDVTTFNALKEKVQKYNPSLIIIDICDKLAPEEDVQNLKKLYDNLRVLSGSGYPIIGTSQSGDTSYFDQENKEIKHKTWLSDHDLYGSKTGKGGSADTMIMIGKDEHSNLRYISVTKKKRGQPVRIVAEIQDIYSYYKEITY